MALPVPDVINTAGIAGKLKHEWSQGAATKAVGNDHSPVQRKLGAISLRGLLGLSASLAEWIQARFGGTSADPQLAFLIEAVWAASIDFRYLATDALDFEEDDTDPVHGPIQECKRLLRRVTEIYAKVDYGIVRYVGALANLTNFVLPDTKAYQAWLKSVTARLPAASTPSTAAAGKLPVAKKKTAPIGSVDTVWGNPLPRELFDPGAGSKAADPALLIDGLLQKIYQPQNPFLRSPGQLAKLGMKGTPYRYGKPKPRAPGHAG